MSQMTAEHAMSTAEAFYRLFCTLSLDEKIAIAHYILADSQVRQDLVLSEVPNSVTLQAFSESKEDMPVFDTVDELVKDLLS